MLTDPVSHYTATSAEELFAAALAELPEGNECPSCRKDLRTIYITVSERGTVIHAADTKFARIGDIGLDRMFGGGMNLLCNNSAGGTWRISKSPVYVHFVTCKRCIEVLNNAD